MVARPPKAERAVKLSSVIIAVLLVLNAALSIALLHFATSPSLTETQVVTHYLTSLPWQKTLVLSATTLMEGGAIGEPTVIFENGTYRMWYSGDEWYKYSPNNKLFYAESADGVHWTKYGYVTDERLSMVVRYNSTTLFLYARGALRQWSNDGIHWTHFQPPYAIQGLNVPQGDDRPSPDGGTFNPSIVQLPNGTWLFYTEVAYNSGKAFDSWLASSPDGIHNWKLVQNAPVFGGPQAGFVCANQDVLLQDGVFYMFCNEYPPEAPAPDIVLGTSNDGVHFIKTEWFDRTPLIPINVETQAYPAADQIGDQEVVVVPDGIYVYYSAVLNSGRLAVIWLAKLPNATLPSLLS